MSTIEILEDLVKRSSYKDGWSFHFYADYERGQGCRGPTVVILISAPNSYANHGMIHVNHFMIVPLASYNERSWRRWLFEQVLLVERHEAMEFFKVDGSRPYAPNHGPGNDPYFVWEVGTLADAQTSSAGERRDVDV